VIVVDASVLVAAVTDASPTGDAARTELVRDQIAIPPLADLEVASALRGLQRSGTLSESAAAQALSTYQRLPLLRADHSPLLARCWQLRDNLTVYDASYVALAELLEAPLVTGDRRLANAAGVRCTVVLLADNA
jgi:predicted nucleic acid-binding protein